MAMSETDKFMDNFDPVNSIREKRKKMRTQPGSGSDSGRGNGNGNNKRDKWVFFLELIWNNWTCN